MYIQCNLVQYVTNSFVERKSRSWVHVVSLKRPSSARDKQTQKWRPADTVYIHVLPGNICQLVYAPLIYWK
jgi:hypothetical protein